MSAPPPRAGWIARVGWFAAIWVASVVALGVVAMILRAFIP